MPEETVTTEPEAYRTICIGIDSGEDHIWLEDTSTGAIYYFPDFAGAITQQPQLKRMVTQNMYQALVSFARFLLMGEIESPFDATWFEVPAIERTEDEESH